MQRQQIILLLVLFVSELYGFVHHLTFSPRVSHRFFASNIDAIEDISPFESNDEPSSIKASLKFLGPYPSIALRFPNCSTKNQKSKNATGVSLDFVVDTAANTNTINAQVANELDLEPVGEALPGIGSAGAITGGTTFMLGDAELEGTGLESFVFMQNLTASALPIASPASAGLLSLAFLCCFEGGVEFDWGSQSMRDGMAESSPSITFYGERSNDDLDKIMSEMVRVPIEPVPVTQLPSVVLKVNGVEIPALLDTGSPITVLNSQAAMQAGVETIEMPSQSQKSNNPFSSIANRIKAAQATANAAANGDLLTVAGTNGLPTNLLRSTSAPDIVIQGDGDKVASFGENRIYVGDIPGLAALNGIGVDSPPAAILGMDLLRKRQKMLLRARDQEVYF